MNLINSVPGYFLGTSLRGLPAQVSDILANKREANNPPKLSEEYEEAIKYFDKYVPEINTQMINRYSGVPENAEMIERISQYFANFIRASLYFGDLSLMASEIAWADILIDNNQMNGRLMQEFLQVYHEVVAEVMGENGLVLQDWLADLHV